jgi:phosphoglycolate phosphatase-like HAD superfamily hydrolase
MHCDDCRKPLAPVVAFDIDGTLGDYHTHLTTMLCDYFNFTEAHRLYLLGLGGVCQWNGEGDFEDWIGLTREQYREGKLAFRQGGYKRWMPTYTTASVAVKAVNEMGYEVWMTTTRPWQRLDNVDPDTQWWLKVNGFSYKHLLFDEDKYAKLAQIVGYRRIVMVLDDLPEMYDRAEELGLPVMQVARRHNTHATQQKPRRGSLSMAVDILRQTIGEHSDDEGPDQLRLSV